MTPDVRGVTHEKISTGQADSKFGFAMAQAGEAIARVERVEGLSLQGVHAHVGSQPTVLMSVVPLGKPSRWLDTSIGF